MPAVFLRSTMYKLCISVLTFTLVILHAVPTVTVADGRPIEIFTVRILRAVRYIITFIDIFITVWSCPSLVLTAWCTADNLVTLVVFTATDPLTVQTPKPDRTFWYNNSSVCYLTEIMEAASWTGVNVTIITNNIINTSWFNVGPRSHISVRQYRPSYGNYHCLSFQNLMLHLHLQLLHLADSSLYNGSTFTFNNDVANTI